MPGLLIDAGASVLCSHGGKATPTAPFPRVTLSGKPVVTLTAPYVVAGCALPPPPAANGPCVSAQWLSGAMRVFAGGAPVLLQSGASVCAPTGTPLMVVMTQLRVSGS
jgi:hypothetical protein